jgi:hypothetical protein
MSVPYGYPTDLSTLLPLVAAQVVSVTSLPAERVLVTLEPDADLDRDPISDVLVTIAPVRFPMDQSQVTGGGIAFENTLGELEIVYFNRYEVDYTHADADALTDANNGILANWRLIMQSLQLFVPLDDNSNGLTSEPMRLIQWNIPKRQKTNPWLRIVSTWKMEFVQGLT